MLEQLTWFGRGSRLELTGGLGMTLESPYAYFVNSNAGAGIEPAAVNLRLTIGDMAADAGSPALPYWPRYDQLSAGQRRYYLNWLAGGRRTVPDDVGYTCLFLYGVERRLLVDRQDVRETIRALLKLMGLYANQAAPADRGIPYAESLIWHLLVRDAALFSIEDLKTLVPGFISVNTDEALAAVLSFWATKAEPLADWLAFDVARELPKSQRSVVPQRTGDEFLSLFRKRYHEQFGPGLPLQVSKRDRRFEYRPANRYLEASQVTAANPAGLMSQFDDLAELWNGCVADLKRLSTLKIDHGAKTLDLWRATPAELRQTVDHPLVEAFAGFVAARTGDSGDVRVTPRDVATLIGMAPDAKLTLPASRRIAEATSEAGYCLEPDARLTRRAYDDAEPIVLFLNLSDAPLDTAKYAAASTMLNVGFAVATADGHADEAELAVLTRQLEAAFDLNETEQRRLEALHGLRAANGVDMADLNRMLRDLNRPQQDLVGRLMLALVAADGQVSKAELKTVRKVYSAMGWEKEAIDAAVATLLPAPGPSAAGDELVTVLPATAGEAGEPIPPRPVSSPAFVLNRAAIDAILRETQDVARLLADAMTPDPLSDIPSPSTATAWTLMPPGPAPATPLFKSPEITSAAVVINDAVIPGLPERYTALYKQIIAQPSWSRVALADLSKSQGLMLSGAIETINDWSTETHGGPLLYDDGDTFTLETAYLTQN